MYEWYDGYSTIGQCKEKDNSIILYPYLSELLPKVVCGALNLQYCSGKKVIFQCPNEAYKALVALYARDLRRKYKPSKPELLKLKTRIENKR